MTSHDNLNGRQHAQYLLPTYDPGLLGGRNNDIGDAWSISQVFPFLASAARSLSRSRRRLFAVLLLLVALLVLAHRDDAVSVHLRDAGYLTRPLWDKTPERFKTVIRLRDDAFKSSSLSTKNDIGIISATCKEHGLDSLGGGSSLPKVYDAVIFSVELDLLEIRIRELYDVVDYFVVVESNVTFSGQPKPYTFKKHEAQFDFAKDKIVYGQVGNLQVYNAARKEDPFENEIRMRVGVSSVIRAQHPPQGSIILQSDVDEIPSARAVSLLKHCTGWEDVIHLGMPSYLYSFEFPLERDPDSHKVNNGEGAGPRQWRASAKRYGSKNYKGYTHSRQSASILEKAGWHMTFAFKYIDDFIFKMRSYSHNDRVTSSGQLDPARIQKKICSGADIFDMLPEAYDFHALFEQWGKIKPSTDTSNIPTAVLQHRERFKYLLPGGCVRESNAP